MPTYQYACTACDHSFEQFQSFSDDALTVCPQCQGRLRKVFNAVGVVFKGSGFYRTDSRSDASSSAKGSSGGTDSSSGSSGSSAGDSASKTSSTETSTPSATKTASKTASSSSAA